MNFDVRATGPAQLNYHFHNRDTIHTEVASNMAESKEPQGISKRILMFEPIVQHYYQENPKITINKVIFHLEQTTHLPRASYDEMTTIEERLQIQLRRV
ncbi:hypothetical protein D3P96_06620 [Weissella viridescens]|uniref:Uncharacterized protein n=1 Tax=Weissella viridescens TaxID=1629 RepID=A0A3P2RIS4_WEIVI|nr:hypothetical protein [Weissella viridescens]RRG17622.1 hypothetical protein D3P96_06620 [Weissella viridescens]